MRLLSKYFSLRDACSVGANRMQIRLGSIYRPKPASTGPPQGAIDASTYSQTPISGNPIESLLSQTLGPRTQTEFTTASSASSEHNDLSQAQRMKRREERKMERVAAAIRKEQLQGVTQRFENNYIDIEKLFQLLARLFEPGSYFVQMQKCVYQIKVPRELTPEERESVEYSSNSVVV